MKSKTKIILLFLVLCAIFSISSVAAADSNSTQIAVSDDSNQISADENVDVQAATNQEELQATNDDEVLSMMGTDASSLDRNVKASIQAKKLTTSYSSGNKFKVKVIDSDKSPVSNAKLLLKVYTGNKYKKITAKTGYDGVAQFDASKLKVGTHKIVISSLNKKIKASAKTSSVKITKAKLLVKAPKVNNAFKQSGKFKVAVKNRATKNAIANVKVTIKVYTGKSSKTFTVKTNKKGVASISTKKLSKGKHKVTVKVKATENLKAKSAKSIIAISNKQATKIDVADASTWFTANYYGTILMINGHVALKDSNGKLLKNKPMTYICRSGGFSGTVLDKGTFKSAKDDSDYTRNLGAGPGAGVPLYFTFIFKGDSKYMASKINYEFYRQMYY